MGENSVSIDTDEVLKGADAIYDIDLLAFFIELKNKAIEWKARVIW